MIDVLLKTIKRIFKKNKKAARFLDTPQAPTPKGGPEFRFKGIL